MSTIYMLCSVLYEKCYVLNFWVLFLLDVGDLSKCIYEIAVRYFQVCKNLHLVFMNRNILFIWEFKA